MKDLPKIDDMLQLTQFTLDHSPDAIFWMKPDGQFIYVNETACRVLGYTRKEMLTMSVSDIDPSLPNGVPLEMSEATKRAGSVRVETQHRTKDGRTIPVEVIVAYMKYKGIEYHCSFVLDKDYNYLSFNNAHSEEMKRLYNASIEVGQNILLYIPREDDRLKAEESYKQVLEGNRFVKIEEYGVGINRFWYELTFNPIKGTLGQVTGFTVCVTEITDRKRAEEELERIFNLTPDMLCIASAERCLLRINHAWEDTLGFSTQELLNKNVMDFIHPDDIEATLTEIERQLNGVETICFENRYICKDGSYKTLAWNAHA